MAERIKTREAFDKLTAVKDKTVLIDFYADRCGPCKMIAPVVAQIAEENQGVIKVGKVNVDNEMPLAQKYRVASIPTLILFKDGKPVQQSIGFATKAEIEKMWK